MALDFRTYSQDEFNDVDGFWDISVFQDRRIIDVSTDDVFSLTAKANPITPNTWGAVAINVQWSNDGFDAFDFAPTLAISAGGGSVENIDVVDKRFLYLTPAATSTTSVYVDVSGTGKS